MKSKLTDIKKDYFERTIHDPSFDTEEGRWEWIESTISQTKQEYLRKGYKDALLDCVEIMNCQECEAHLRELSNK